MAVEWKNLDECSSFSKLEKIKLLNKDELVSENILKRKAPAGSGLEFYYASTLLGEKQLDLLKELAEEQQLIEKYKLLLDGERINTGENRRVLHQLTRGRLGKDIVEDGINIADFYREQLSRIENFAEKVHSGDIKGSTGRKFDTVVQIGIGGSDLGPRAMYLALKNKYPEKMKAFFVSNVDPDDAAEIISLINPETTLFILVSKSGTTQETLANRDLILSKMKEKGIAGYNPDKHLIAVTSKTSPLAESSSVLDSFFIDDYIGGRYSSTSAVGGAVLSLAYGADVFKEFLAGANKADRNALEEDIFKNAAMLDAMIGIYYRNILGFGAAAVLPYSQALSRFPAHLQQLDMESNGKSVNRFGSKINYSTGPLIFGEPGTNGQHSFYQLLHQGTDIVPLQFIGFEESQAGTDMEIEGSTSQTKLKANLAAQITAFAKGSFNENPNKNFEGGRPATLLKAKQLNAETLGALLAHFENKVMFQGFCWNINSFDQEGVQLGKVLTKSVLSGSSNDSVLNTFADILKIR